MTRPHDRIWIPYADPGDILWCRFPEIQGLKKPGPKPRPALVVAMWDEETPLRLRLAYGTSRRVQTLYPWEFALTLDDADAFIVSGLTWPTKFDLRNTVDLPYTHNWFEAAPGASTPKLGRLDPQLASRAYKAHLAASRPRR